MNNSRNTLVTKSSKSLIKTETHEVTIMKMLNRKPPGLHKKAIGIAAGIFLSAFLMPGSAFATTAANAVITNTATVNYDDAGGFAQAQILASASVTVNLVTAAPTLSLPIDATTPSTVALDYTYTITNNSNGLDNYTLSSADSLWGAGITQPVPMAILDTGFAAIASIDLGATSAAAIAAVGDSSITVPNDGSADASQNGIAVGDVIVIGPDVVTVTAVTDTGAGTDIITFAADTLTVAVAVGDQIGEQGTFIMRTTPVTSTSGHQYTVTVTATDGANPTTDATVTTVTLITLTVTKYVANITTPVVPAGPPASVTLTTGLSGAPVTYYVSGVTGNPGEVLEYVIGIVSTAGSGTATDVIISDPVPAFTSLTDSRIALDPDGLGFDPVVDGALTGNGDFGETDGATVYIYAGTGGADGVIGVNNGTGGSLAGGVTTYGAFQVAIDN